MKSLKKNTEIANSKREEKAALARECLSLYDKVKVAMEQDDVEVITDSCREFIDTAYDYFVSQKDDFIKTRIFHNACSECISLRHYARLYHETQKESAKNFYSDAYWQASDRLKGYMETIKESLKKRV